MEGRNTNKLNSPVSDVTDVSHVLEQVLHATYVANEENIVCKISKTKNPLDMGGFGNQ